MHDRSLRSLHRYSVVQGLVPAEDYSILETREVPYSYVGHKFNAIPRVFRVPHDGVTRTRYPSVLAISCRSLHLGSEVHKPRVVVESHSVRKAVAMTTLLLALLTLCCLGSVALASTSGISTTTLRWFTATVCRYRASSIQVSPAACQTTVRIPICKSPRAQRIQA